ncbi:MAG: lactate dehydrogenase [Cyanobium sp.]|jgi:hypothetical protein|nr:lactate dehydrogenase [Synechococcaceae cyanobacterium]
MATRTSACRPLQPQGRHRCQLLALIGLLLVSLPAVAGVQFQNCVRGSGGAISCDTVPTGNTLMQAIEARAGLLQQASPGWSEFDPFAGYNEDFGGDGM